MMERKAKYILLSMSIFIGSVAIGAASSLGVTSSQPEPHRMFELMGLTNPFPMLVWVYMIWNAYHFGMQNFGAVELSADARRARSKTHSAT
jgi:hypothetical protein